MPRRRSGQIKDADQGVTGVAEGRKGGISVPLHWQVSDQIPILYANQIFVRLQEEGQVLVTFGRVEPPHETPLSEKTQERLKKEGLPVHAVARLAVTPERLGTMIEHLNTIFNRWQETQRQTSSRLPKKARSQ